MSKTTTKKNRKERELTEMLRSRVAPKFKNMALRFAAKNRMTEATLVRESVLFFMGKDRA